MKYLIILVILALFSESLARSLVKRDLNLGANEGGWNLVVDRDFGRGSLGGGLNGDWNGNSDWNMNGGIRDNNGIRWTGNAGGHIGSSDVNWGIGASHTTNTGIDITGNIGGTNGRFTGVGVGINIPFY